MGWKTFRVPGSTGWRIATRLDWLGTSKGTGRTWVILRDATLAPGGRICLPHVDWNPLNLAEPDTTH